MSNVRDVYSGLILTYYDLVSQVGKVTQTKSQVEQLLQIMTKPLKEPSPRQLKLHFSLDEDNEDAPSFTTAVGYYKYIVQDFSRKVTIIRTQNEKSFAIASNLITVWNKMIEAGFTLDTKFGEPCIPHPPIVNHGITNGEPYYSVRIADREESEQGLKLVVYTHFYVDDFAKQNKAQENLLDNYATWTPLTAFTKPYHLPYKERQEQICELKKHFEILTEGLRKGDIDIITRFTNSDLVRELVDVIYDSK